MLSCLGFLFIIAYSLGGFPQSRGAQRNVTSLHVISSFMFKCTWVDERGIEKEISLSLTYNEGSRYVIKWVNLFEPFYKLTCLFDWIVHICRRQLWTPTWYIRALNMILVSDLEHGILFCLQLYHQNCQSFIYTYNTYASTATFKNKKYLYSLSERHLQYLQNTSHKNTCQ